MAGKAGALRHALGVTPLQTAFSSIRRPAGDVAHLILSGPSVADIGYSELDLPAVMGVNGSIALRQPSAPAFRLLRDVGRRLRVAPPRPGRRRAGARPAAVRHAGGATRDRAAVFSGRHSLPHRGLRKVHQRAYLPARSRNNWRGRCATTRIWCCSTPMRRSIRWVSAWIRPEGSSAAARWPIAPCNCWSGWDSARSICMVWTCAGECFAAFLRVRRCAPAERAGQAVRLTHPACLSRRQPVARRARPADLQPVARQRPGRACFPSAIGRR